jgi:exopolysaccharide biosynthesis polyprenyl glycosylphosphotransferase
MVTKAQETQSSSGLRAEAAPVVRFRQRPWSLWLKRRGANRALLLVGDVFAVLLSHWIAEALVQHFLRIPPSTLNPSTYTLFYLPFLLAVFYVLEKKQSAGLRRPEKELELVFKGVSFAFLLLVCANFVVFKREVFSRYLMVSWYLLALALLLVTRFGIRAFYGWLWRQGLARRRTLLVGSPGRLAELQTRLAIQRHPAYELLGIVPAGDGLGENEAGNFLPVLGPPDRWFDIARAQGAEQVIICLAKSGEESHQLVSDILKRCLPAGIDVQVYSDLFASREFNYELDGFSGFFRFYAAARWSKKAQAAAKAVLDRLAGLVGSTLTLLVFPVVALLIKLEDGGPVFFPREFVDCDGNVRYYRKFRTMYTRAEEILNKDPKLKAKYEEKHKLVDDPRVTRVGRFLRKYSIDEWPEFFSVLGGQLALVGPRVISRDEVKRYGPYLPKLLSVKPGLTGVWQVMGRQLTTYQERVRMDMFYIDHWSIWLDLWIVVKTFWKVFRAEGAY